MNSSRRTDPRHWSVLDDVLALREASLYDSVESMPGPERRWAPGAVGDRLQFAARLAQVTQHLADAAYHLGPTPSPDDLLGAARSLLMPSHADVWPDEAAVEAAVLLMDLGLAGLRGTEIDPRKMLWPAK